MKKKTPKSAPRLPTASQAPHSPKTSLAPEAGSDEKGASATFAVNAFAVTGGILYVVATPIGNLEDLTPRAKRILREVDVILAEDTRVTRELLFAIDAPKKHVVRFDSHREHSGLDEVRGMLGEGKSVALVSDAGTPGISDPGALLVSTLQEEGYSVSPIPGASAVPTFVSAVGIHSAAFTFSGFLPREKKKRGEIFRNLLETNGGRSPNMRANTEIPARIWFESPERIGETLELLAEILPDFRLCVGKELTKRFERFWVGSTTFVYEAWQKLAAEEKRGEWLILLEKVHHSDSGGKNSVENPANSSESAENAFIETPPYEATLRSFRVAGVSLSDAVRAVCQVFGANRNEVYRAGLKFFSD